MTSKLNHIEYLSVNVVSVPLVIIKTNYNLSLKAASLSKGVHVKYPTTQQKSAPFLVRLGREQYANVLTDLVFLADQRMFGKTGFVMPFCPHCSL